MTTAISTSDPNTERGGGRCGWSIRTSLSGSTSLGSSLPVLCVMNSLPLIRVRSCQAAHVSLAATAWSPGNSRGTGTLGTFYPLFPKNNYFTEASIQTPMNVVHVNPYVQVQPRGDFAFMARHRYPLAAEDP
jgi:hypothetical protein